MSGIAKILKAAGEIKVISWRGLPLVILGTDGTSIEAATIIDEINSVNYIPVYNVLGYISKKETDIGLMISGYHVISCDSKLDIFVKDYSILAVVIPFGNVELKKRLVEHLIPYKNLIYPSIIHPRANISKKLTYIGAGNVIHAGVSITSNIEIGNFNLINPNVTIGHNTIIGDYCSINPLASISGYVVIHDNVIVGTGANIIQQITINRNAVIAAGAVVINDIEANLTVAGVPARSIKKVEG